MTAVAPIVGIYTFTFALLTRLEWGFKKTRYLIKFKLNKNLFNNLKNSMMNNKRNPPPTKIYKFYRINDDLKNTLRDNYIWLSNPNNFNDPFDCYKNLLTIKPTKDNIKRLFNNSNQSRKHRRDNFNHYKNRPVKLRKVINEYLEENIENYGVASFCKEYENTLMWSHYADFHRGYVYVLILKRILNSS